MSDGRQSWTPALIEAMQTRALAEGFEVCGVADAPGSEEPAGESTAARFTTWVDVGRAGDMEYLKRRDAGGELLRRSARVAMPWARSVMVCGFHYDLGGPGSLAAADAGAGWIGRYAWLGTEAGGAVDYHDELLRRLRGVEADLRSRVDCETRCYVDTGPVIERDFAARAGVGWVGKNTCVLNQQWGSWMLLAVMVTSLEVPQAELAMLAPDRCGSCTRCLDACPTGALVAPREMDAVRCIAYLTIEKKGSIAEDLREGMGRQVFGCDICQDVCPWNRESPVTVKAGLEVRRELVNPSLDWLGGMDQAEFKRAFAGSPLERTKRPRLLRNVAIAMGNSGEQRFVPRLRAWAMGEDEVLAESARWALGKLGVDVAGGAGLVASGQEHAHVDVFANRPATPEE
jgi:epoxyqueuosine reductase